MGIPEVMRSDDGPQYAAKTFEKFTKDLEFQLTPSSLGYPRSNRLAEKTVQPVKDLLEKAKEDNKDPYLAMLEERNTPAIITNLQQSLPLEDNFNQFYLLAQTI